MHIECLKSIRNCSRIERLVYVSCNPVKSLVRDAAILCGPVSNRMHGMNFKPVAAVPVDLFPMTPHCEMILVFDRCA
jgi:tRNA/tmRNA/rRNA uracil-C5-methylase (TrmA/RlmC/RlmD family)